MRQPAGAFVAVTANIRYPLQARLSAFAPQVPDIQPSACEPSLSGFNADEMSGFSSGTRLLNWVSTAGVTLVGCSIAHHRATVAPLEPAVPTYRPCTLLPAQHFLTRLRATAAR